jgi:hypothetical protein
MLHSMQRHYPRPLVLLLSSYRRMVWEDKIQAAPQAKD